MRDGSVIAVVPAFNPDDGFDARMRALLKQVDGLVIVDDGSSDPLPGVARLEAVPAILVHRQANLGIAAALNAGIGIARATWPHAIAVITVDQDSELAADYVARALEAGAAATRAGTKVAGVCVERFNDWAIAASTDPHGTPVTLQLAQSGTMLPIEALDRLGVFDESLFIDVVDTEYALRARRAGFAIVVGAGCNMQHAPGVSRAATLFGRQLSRRGRPIRFVHHSALRRYYITRNRMLVYGKYGGVAPAWALWEFLLEARRTGAALVFGPDRARQALGLWLGFVDGVRRRRGPATTRQVERLGGS